MENETTAQTTSTSRHSLIMPAVVLLGFAMIAAALFFGGGSPKAINFAADSTPEASPTDSIEPINKDDHIRGNPNAPIMLVEYSDYDCPFCKQFHNTMNQIMEEYGVDGKVAWVYRQFPLEQLHPNAPKIAEAAECVADLGGNEAFWSFSDLVFDERSTNEPTNITRLSEFAVTAGVDETEFESCLESGEFASNVNADLMDGSGAGVQGTPHTFVLVAGQQTEISGAQPYTTVKTLIDTILSQIES